VERAWERGRVRGELRKSGRVVFFVVVEVATETRI
jgi:hypothetical protein